MAKASACLAPPGITSKQLDLAVVIAAQVLELIGARAQSPHLEEISEIVLGVLCTAEQPAGK